MKKYRQLVVGILGLIVVLTLQSCAKDTHSNMPTPKATVTSKPTTEPTTGASEYPEIVKDEVLSVDYRDMWKNYSDDLYTGKYVRIIGSVETSELMKPIYFTEGLGEGMTDSISISGKTEVTRDRFLDGDIVVATGYVREKILGTIYIENAEITIAEDADIAQMEDYNQAREEKEVSDAKEYKESAVVISYDDLIREPDKHEGKIIEITIEISQLFESKGAFGALFEKGYAGAQDGNEWIVAYELPEDAKRILEDDIVTFYGEYDGVEERTRSLTGNEVYIPHLTAKYHVIN